MDKTRVFLTFTLSDYFPMILNLQCFGLLTLSYLLSQQLVLPLHPLALLPLPTQLPLYPVPLTQHLLVPLLALSLLPLLLCPEGLQLLFEAGNYLALVSVEPAVLV